MERWLKGVNRVATFSNDAECSKAVRAENTAITDPDDDATTSSSTISKTKKRKYDESYISFGFVNSNGSLLCMLCSKLLPNSSMAAAKLRRHLETVHSESKDKNKEFFVRKKEQLLDSQKNMIRVTQTINEKATEASYLVSYRIAQAGEAHTITENLIKPCVLDITKCILDEKSAKHLSTVPLSNDIVSRRIHNLASFFKQELVTRLQKTRFALQIDESTDVAGQAILLVIVRYPYESFFEEDMLMCSPLPTNTTGEEIFNKINIFFEENNLSWNDCIDICTDGVKAMTDKRTERLWNVAGQATASQWRPSSSGSPFSFRGAHLLFGNFVLRLKTPGIKFRTEIFRRRGKYCVGEVYGGRRRVGGFRLKKFDESTAPGAPEGPSRPTRVARGWRLPTAGRVPSQDSFTNFPSGVRLEWIQPRIGRRGRDVITKITITRPHTKGAAA
ncbi:Zinc finger BED domain-containing protein 5 [Eumeta japonica]|uniref:Zinc finger BED domain-containing protein 5 n=1 Tax=Eumeta variegata TaxID=151549 RepID=A0A4C1W0J1_EUMVA|nr:Zinc finger BED domain-containing protein 5 [Eumeta japonica]